MVRLQRGFVKHIWLRTKLQEYSCPSCRRAEGIREIFDNHDIIHGAIWKLFSILSSWKRDSDRRGGSGRGLALELSAHSPSVSRHAFKECYFETVAYSESITDGEYKPSNFYDRRHNWVNGRQIVAPDEDSILRVFGHRVELGLEQKLPDVNVVTTFLIRRQTRRQFTSESLRQILVSLPRLECVNYEPARPLFKDERIGVDEGMYISI